MPEVSSTKYYRQSVRNGRNNESNNHFQMQMYNNHVAREPMFSSIAPDTLGLELHRFILTQTQIWQLDPILCRFKEYLLIQQISLLNKFHFNCIIIKKIMLLY